MPFVLAHVSDFHVSTFGDTLHDRTRIVRRSTNVADESALEWTCVWSEAGWKVLKKKSKLLVIDPEGYSHAAPGRGEFRELTDPIERAAGKACRLEARRSKTLASSIPSEGALAILADATPRNANVRLLRAARYVEQANVDGVAITGDITDDGDGYDLAAAAFEKWRARGRLYAVPGNHDRYLFPISGSTRPKPTQESKAAAWRAFAASLDLPLEPSGAWLKVVPNADVVILGLDTCARPQRRFFRHNGAVGADQLAFARAVGSRPEWRGARHRVVMLHHHVVPLPHGVGKRAPSEIGMRLDDAQGAAECFDAIGATLVMHGHRHISEERQPAGVGFRLLAAPSLTLGCRSGDGPSFWRIELGDHVYATRVPVPISAIDEDEEEPESES
ncbi:MAG TPA: metallophosphoesterase [Polyangiaceae bacterium]